MVVFLQTIIWYMYQNLKSQASLRQVHPVALYERFRVGKSHALVCTQFICALNIQLGDDDELSQEAMSEFYQNHLMQALSKSNSEILLNFDEISQLVRNIKQQMGNTTFKIENVIDCDEEETAGPNILELKVTETIAENRDIEYPTDEYNKTYMPQTEQEIKEEKEQITFCRLQLNTIQRALRQPDI